MFARAALQYRRDLLWAKLTGSASQRVSFDEVEELFSLVDTLDVESLDGRLVAFRLQPTHWHHALVRLLAAPPYHVRHVAHDDGVRSHAALVWPGCPDAVVAVSVGAGGAALQLVRRLRAEQRLSAEQRALIEYFVNRCAYALWAAKVGQGPPKRN